MGDPLTTQDQRSTLLQPVGVMANPDSRISHWSIVIGELSQILAMLSQSVSQAIVFHPVIREQETNLLAPKRPSQ